MSKLVFSLSISARLHFAYGHFNGFWSAIHWEVGCLSLHVHIFQFFSQGSATCDMISSADALMLPILVNYFDERQLAINLAIYSLRGFLFNGLMRPNTP